MADEFDLYATRVNALEHPRLLVVEGLDDLQVVHGIRRVASDVPEFAIYDAGGIDELLKMIRQLLSSSGRETLGLVADGNSNLKARWQQLMTELQRSGVVAPGVPDSMGTIIDRTSFLPRVGVWLMPDNHANGELEDFIARLVPQSDPLWPRAKDYIRGIPSGERKFKRSKALRAHVHAWLAVRQRPRPLDRAIEAGDLDIDAPLCQAFVEWLQRLFGDDEAKAS
ncbi:DUF3226 domain-containing protein [Candidatus Poriferisodalis sp.]|uniref:DUF3226 domain-containing protein n=1 Tax=Candidatus Poriferisodalis sp. TaxID=3101277 RepID=UPI003B020FCF